MKINDWANILRGCAEIIKTDTTDEVTGLSTLRETVNGVPVNMTLEVIARKLDELSKDIQRCSDMSVHFVEKNDHRTTNDGLCYFLGSVEATFEMDSQLLTRLHKIESDLFEERKKIVAKKISP